MEIPRRPNRPRRLLVSFGGVAAAAAIVFVAKWGWSTATAAESDHAPVAVREVLQPVQAKSQCQSIAPTERAEALLNRLFPKAVIHFAEPFPVSDSTCLLEVEMSVDPANPVTRGFVYVLPDGERFLNGPLMDKRSKVEISTTDPAALQDALNAQQRAMDLLSQQQTRTSSQGDIESNMPNVSATPEASAPPKSGGALRRELHDKLAQLPSLTGGNPDGRPVYVLLDPQCVACQRLFADRDQLAEMHNIHWQWIPLATTEEGWIKNASVLKTATTSPEQAMAMLEEIMQRKWKAQEHIDLIKSLREDDYAIARKASEVFADLAKSSSGAARTPLVAFERPNKSVEVFAGIPLDTDWLSLSIDPLGSSIR